MLSFDNLSQLSRVQGVTGVDSAGVPFLDLSSKLPPGGLLPGAQLPPFTLSMDQVSGVPSLAAVLYRRPPNLSAPRAVPQALATDEDVPLSILLGGSDADGDALAFSVLVGPSKGILRGTAPDLVYVPSPDAHGADRFTFKVNDGWVDSQVVSVDIDVRPVNDPPFLRPIPAQSTVEDVATPPIAIVLGDVETPPGSLTVSAVSSIRPWSRPQGSILRAPAPRGR